MSTVGRRDTPAARAALARRRQRAAQMLRPSNSGTSTRNADRPSVATNGARNGHGASTAVGEGTKPPAKGVINASQGSPSRLPPSGSPPKPRKQPLGSISSSPRSPRKNVSNSQHIQKAQTVGVNGGRIDPPVREVVRTPHPPNRNNLSPLARRAYKSMHKSSTSPTAGTNGTIDGTLTTAALTSSSAGKSSPDKSSISYATDPRLARQFLAQSKEVAAAAHSILFAEVSGTTSYHDNLSRASASHEASFGRRQHNGHTTSQSTPQRNTSPVRPSTRTPSSIASSVENRPKSQPKPRLHNHQHHRGQAQAQGRMNLGEGPLAARQNKFESSTIQKKSNNVTSTTRLQKLARERSKSPAKSQREETLAASRKHRAALESRHKFNVSSRSTQPSPTRQSSATRATRQHTPLKSDPIHMQTATRRRRSPSPQARSANRYSDTLVGDSPAGRRDAQVETHDDDPLLASRRLIEQSETEIDYPGLNDMAVPRRATSPRRQSPLKSLSPRRFLNTGLPPSGRQPSPRRNTQSSPSKAPRDRVVDHRSGSVGSAAEHREDIRPSNIGQRSPSPSRQSTVSPWIEKDPPREMQKPKLPPLQTRSSFPEVDEYKHPPSQYQPPSRQRYSSPIAGAGTSTGTSPYRSDRGEGRNSPGVERLSSFLMDSSSAADISTIGEITNHQMEPLPDSSRFGSSRPSTAATPIEHGENAPYDDQITIDDGKLLGKDSACLLSGSKVMLRCCSNNATIGARTRHDEHSFWAQPSGICLGRNEEVLSIRKVAVDHGSDDELRYGDIVLLQSDASHAFNLAARKISTDGVNFHSEIGFFSPGTTKAETWMILWGKVDKEIFVGRAAVTARPVHQNQDSAKLAPVRSGDPVVLRNCQSGGVLSVNRQGNLILLTDSYEASKMQSFKDPSLIGRLQNHDKLRPSQKELFQFLLSSTPPCPQWVAGKGPFDRIFLTGSYILQPRRNQRSAEFESELFSSATKAKSLPLLKSSERHDYIDTAVLPASVKEKILIDEVIGSFLGLEGRHIRLKGAKGHTSSFENFEFRLFGADGVDFDVSLCGLVEQILPLSTSYVRVRNFISSRHPGYEFGRVMHAFCQGLDTLLQDYVTFVAQLEQKHRSNNRQADSLTMKSIYFQITPSLHSMSILEHATKAVREKKGGALINTLWTLDKRVYMGDTVAKRVLGILLEKSSVPYMEMMTSWLQSGILRDPYEEFMVYSFSKNQKKGQSAEVDGDAWMTMFSINEDHALECIVTGEWTKQKILTTGKYWNAAHACHVDMKKIVGSYIDRSIPKLSFNSDSSAIAAYIEAMYQKASRVLVNLMMQNFRLMDSLQVMKRYFLIDQGDFLMHFLDAAEGELQKPKEEVSVGRVQHWLSMSVQITEAHREDFEFPPDMCSSQLSGQLLPSSLRCQFSEEGLVSHLDSLYGGIANSHLRSPSRNAYGAPTGENTGIELFQIDFPRIPFPLSLVLSKQAMSNYRLLFRHLCFTKHVERRLIGVWRDHQVLKKLDSLRGLLGATFLLRQRMLHFVQNLIYYMTFEVVESNWIEMQSSIDVPMEDGNPQNQKHQTVDDILRVHNDFLYKTLEACLLTNQGLIHSLTKLMNTCLLFTDQMRKFMDTTRIYDDSTNIAAEKRGVIQKNLNERGLAPNAADKKVMRRALVSLKEEHAAVLYRQTRRVGREISGDSYKRMVRRFDEVFTSDLAEFIAQLNSHNTSGVVANLGIRLDYNGYVTNSIAMIDPENN